MIFVLENQSLWQRLNFFMVLFMSSFNNVKKVRFTKVPFLIKFELDIHVNTVVNRVCPSP